MIIPRYGDFIKHEASMDVAIRVDKVHNLGHKFEIKGIWWNQGYNDSYCINSEVKFTIRKEKLKYWLICENPNAKCIRHEKWTPLAK